MPLDAIAKELVQIPELVLVLCLMGQTFHMCIVMVAGEEHILSKFQNNICCNTFCTENFLKQEEFLFTGSYVLLGFSV